MGIRGASPKKKISFLKTALKDRDVAAVSSSSPFVVKQVMKHVAGVPKTMIEYGAGSGVMTEALLKALSPEGRLIAIESNAEFSEGLRRIPDPRLQVFEGTVRQFYEENTEDIGADIVVSSIPLSFFTPAERDSLVRRTQQALAEEGTFIIFHQYSPLMKKVMSRYFLSVDVAFEPLNIFPCFIIRASGKKEGI